MLQHQTIHAYYAALLRAYGPQHWWPAKTRLEMIVGAYLTQNTSWKNVEKALANLRRARVLSIAGLRRIAEGDLEELLRPSGYFRQKAARLKTFIRYLDEFYGGSLDHLFAQPTTKLRKELLSLKGVGPETADSILLYAGGHPVFVVDVYTRRIFDRHGILPHSSRYDQIRDLVEAAFETGSLGKEEIARDFNELHALIVSVGKQHCNATARCEGCPLQPFLPME